MRAPWNEQSIDNRDALLYGTGVGEEMTSRPVVGIINSWNDMNPGHYHFRDIVDDIKQAVRDHGGYPVELPVTGVCDGMCTNMPGDRYTLPSRDLVAAEVETVAEVNNLDAMILMCACDKVVPGMIMGAIHADIPAVMLSGGYMEPGDFDGEMITVVHVKKAYSTYMSGKMSREDYKRMVRQACPTPGGCPMMSTGTTMCAIAEVLGFTPHGNAGVPAMSEEWRGMAAACGKRIMELHAADKKPRDFLTRASFENATRYVMATGGSTNVVLHLITLAKQAGFDFTPGDFEVISNDTPIISTIYPSHPTASSREFWEAGALAAVVKELAAGGKLIPARTAFSAPSPTRFAAPKTAIPN